MEALASLADRFGEDPVVTLAVLALAGGALLLFAIFALASDRKEIRRRASGGVEPATAPVGAPGQPAKAQPFEGLVAFLDQNLSGDAKQNRLLRLQLIQAGFFDQRAVAIYFGARLAGAIAFGLAELAFLPFLFGETTGATSWL
jgi:tight adherence protein C